MAFPQIFTFECGLLLRVLLTITSPIFCELVVELRRLPYRLNKPSSEHWGSWGKVDKFLEQRFADRADFKVIFRTDRSVDSRVFQRHAKESFSRLASRECIHFETSHN
jgi:hypothetical protein